MNYSILKPVLGITFLLLSLNITAQDPQSVIYTSSNKGKFFISWGGNRKSFSKSDINFKGEDYILL